MQYKIFISNPVEHFISIQWQVSNPGGSAFQIQLPSWRPGRYELANYAKNVRCFNIHNAEGKPVAFKKITKDCWQVYAHNINELTVSYEYYANQYDAGACYVDDKQLYVNPVNCFMYVVGRMHEPLTVTLHVPADYKVACQLPLTGLSLQARHFDELADSPFIASAGLSHARLQVKDTTLHLWFMGAPCPQIDRLLADTRKYTEAQEQIFGELPCRHYHFLYHILETPFRHGVEHADSTVIAMGPASEWMSPGFYNDLLAISSHELFHLWNVKRIRPVEMLPYDFTTENYSELGYVYEGITTYYGDLMLMRSGVWSFEDYAASFNSDLQRHLDNPGRFNYSVAQSSFDTWLDGYVPGVKGRKVSIYIEGMLAAIIADITLLKATGGKARLDDVLRALYHETFKQGKGYTKETYRLLLERYSGLSFESYFDEVIDGAGHIETHLHDALSHLGLTYVIAAEPAVNPRVRLVRLDNPGAAQQRLFEIWSEKQ